MALVSPVKKNIRKFFLEKRQHMSDQERATRTKLVKEGLDRVLVERGWTGRERIHCFLPIVNKGEIDTFGVLDALWERYPSLEVWVPVTDQALCKEGVHLSGNRMGLARWKRGDPLVLDRWGIPTPIVSDDCSDGSSVGDFDAVLIPMLAFDLRGNRVGYGKGYYDRFLASLDKRTCKIGLHLEPALTEAIRDVDSRDITMDIVVTPDRVYYFNK